MNKKDNSGKTLQDVGICIMLVSFLLSALLFSATKELYLEGILMLTGMFIAVLFSFFRLTGFSIVIASLEAVALLAYKVYRIVVNGDDVPIISFGWIGIVAMAVVGSLLFVNGLKRVQLENQILKQQVEELVMIDPLTGFYNLRSMFMDTQTQISYAERNGKAICLMIIKLRYVKELKTVLKQSQYEEVIKRLSKLVFDTVRLEDRVYAIDNEGSLGVLLTCDKTGSKSVLGRLRSKLENPTVFEGIAPSQIRVEVKIGCLQYNKEEFQRDVKLFKERVEEEVEYDI